MIIPSPFAVHLLYAQGLTSPIYDLQEITGLRNEHLNQFLPPRRAKSSKAEGEDLTKSGSRRIRLHFTHVPVTDLGIPKLMQCVASSYP